MDTLLILLCFKDSNNMIHINVNQVGLAILFIMCTVLRLNQPNGVMSSASVYLTTPLLDRLFL